MKTLQLEESKAKKLFKDSPEWFKETLISSFGSECFSEKITDRIKTFEDACTELGISNNSSIPIFDEDEYPDEIAYKKLKVIIAAINEGWKPDWNDSNQKKWYPYFRLSSGFGFSGSGYDYTYTSTHVGSRLCFKNEELATYAGNQFLDLYEQFLTLK